MMGNIPVIGTLVDDSARCFLDQNRAAGHYKLAGFLYLSSRIRLFGCSMALAKLKGEIMRTRISLSICTSCAATIVLLAGCSFPESSVLKAFVAKSGLPQSQKYEWLGSFSLSEDDSRVVANYDAILNVSEDQQSNFNSTMISQCTNLVIASGGKITGNGFSDSKEIGNIGNTEDRTFTYEAGKTEGTILLLTTEIDKSRLQIRVIIFECRRRW